MFELWCSFSARKWNRMPRLWFYKICKLCSNVNWTLKPRVKCLKFGVNIVLQLRNCRGQFNDGHYTLGPSDSWSRSDHPHRIPETHALPASITPARIVMWARRLFSRNPSLRHYTLSFNRNRIPLIAVPAFRNTFRMASTLPRLPIFEALKKHDATSTAVIHGLSGRSFTYGELVNDIAAAKDKLQHNTNGKSAEGERIAFLVENGYDYVGAH